MIANKPQSPSLLADVELIQTPDVTDKDGVFNYFWNEYAHLTPQKYDNLQNNKFINVLSEFGVQGVINYFACAYDNDDVSSTVKFGCRIEVDGNIIFSKSDAVCGTEAEAMFMPIGMGLWNNTDYTMHCICATPVYFYRDFSVDVFASDYEDTSTLKRIAIFYDYLITGQARL